METAHAFMALAALPDFGPIRIRTLLDHFGGDVQAVFRAGRSELLPVLGHRRADILLRWERHFDLPRELVFLEDFEARYVTCFDDGFPELLKAVEDAPVGLYARGALDLGGRECVALVGTRHPTPYGRRVCRVFARELALRGFVIVSGLARGIDGEVHRAVLEAGGDTAAVLGNGVDIIYPPEHRDLHADLLERGAILSEFYFGRYADRQSFPQRNRIVSGMSRAVIVIESDDKGGSMITARFALEQGRSVFAVPGQIDNPVARGCHRLIRDGAALADSVDEVLSELSAFCQIDFSCLTEPSVEKPLSLEERLSRFRGLSDADRRVVHEIAKLQSVHPDQLCEALDLAPAQISALLLGLELKRVVEKFDDGSFSLRL